MSLYVYEWEIATNMHNEAHTYTKLVVKITRSYRSLQTSKRFKQHSQQDENSQWQTYHEGTLTALSLFETYPHLFKIVSTSHFQLNMLLCQDVEHVLEYKP